ncbi:cobyrinate a,c-diamide synthase [Brucellaceae bacterium C25G]
MKGFVIAAPCSGSGKTTVTLGLLRVLKDRGLPLAPAKIGPDYIDPAFHAAASGEKCFNLDPWGMRDELISALAGRMTEGGKLLIAEGMMGLYDGAMDGTGSAADLAELLGLPVVLVVDCARQSHSVAALVEGFSNFRADIMVGGVILNRVGTPRHEQMLREALSPLGIPVLGAIPRIDSLKLPERHLGLVQANEHGDLDAFIDNAASVMRERLDFVQLERIWKSVSVRGTMANVKRLPSLGQHIAIARDDAFTFAYQHLIDGWVRRGAKVSFFSPLKDEAPHIDCDSVYLPGGYPELFAERLSNAAHFHADMHRLASANVPIYGECGGYMMLGETLEDANGQKHKMLGLLPLETSFAKRRLHLGYRKLKPLAGAPWQTELRGHEFHYASIEREGGAERLYQVSDAIDEELGFAGLRVGSVSGSFMHVIDLVGDDL